MTSRRAPFILAFFALATLTADAFAGPEKVSPLLRKYTHPEREGLLDYPGTLRQVGVLGAAEATGGIRCLVQGDLTREDLEAHGVTVGTQAGTVFTAVIPEDRLLAVSDLPGLVRIEPARPVRTTLDIATANTNVRSEVHGGNAPPWSGNTGAGVLVGAVDSGADYSHSDFQDALGNTRFDRIWDQNVVGTPPAGYAYGSEFTTAQIQAGTAATADPDGHGTHVLGIAGGDGSATGVGSAPAHTFVGVAPEATLAMVATDFSDVGIVDGCNWIFQRGAALGMPAVANLSLGNQYGPHDGTDPFEVALDALTGPGKIIVTSASNDRGAGLHARGSVPAAGSPSSVTFSFVVSAYSASPGTQNDLVLFSGWHDGSESYSVTVTTPNGFTATVAPGVFNQVNTNDGAIQIDNATTTPSNGDDEIFIAFFDAVVNRPPKNGTWTIRFDRVVSTGQNIDVWMYFSTMASGFTVGATDDVTVGNPACAAELIAVAAYTTKASWPSRDGNTYQWNPVPTLFDIADFSGRGPTRTGGQKPDIAAPGFGVVSALSDDVAISPGVIPLILPGDQHWILSGTSMASPMVAGLAALLQAKEGPLTPAEVKMHLADYAGTDAFTGSVWNEDWGWGKMNAEPADVLGPAVSVTAPDGGESYDAGDPVTITWSASDNFGVTAVDLHYSTDGGATYPHLIVSGVANTGSYGWTAPAIASTTMRVKVAATDTVDNAGEDASDSDFTIVIPDVVGPSVTVTAPNGGESLMQGAPVDITWTASDPAKALQGPLAAPIAGVDSVAVWYSLDNGANWILEASGEENDGVYAWAVPAATTDSALVRVEAWDAALNEGSDESDAVFSIAAPLAAGDTGIPAALLLGQNRPNPLRGSAATEIAFGLPRDAHAVLRVFDARGGLVATLADGVLPAGNHRVRWEGRDRDGASLPSGLYFYRLETPDGELNRKLLLVR